MRRSRSHGSHESERWLVSYADFVTLLFAFFVVLFATSRSDTAKLAEVENSFSRSFDPTIALAPGTSSGANTPVKPPAESGNSDIEGLRRALERSLTQNQTSIRQKDGRIIVRVQDGTLFDVGQAVLRPESEPLVAELAQALQTLPRREVWLEGHTDNTPISTADFPSNWELSTARAIALLDALVEQENVPPLRFGASGYGEFRPIQSNATTAGRASNRRVDIVILPNAAPVPASPSPEATPPPAPPAASPPAQRAPARTNPPTPTTRPSALRPG